MSFCESFPCLLHPCRRLFLWIHDGIDAEAAKGQVERTTRRLSAEEQEEARRQINPRDGWIPEEPAAAAAVILSHASSRNRIIAQKLKLEPLPERDRTSGIRRGNRLDHQKVKDEWIFSFSFILPAAIFLSFSFCWRLISSSYRL